jgi:uncharacterized protein (UPF0264 family)
MTQLLVSVRDAAEAEEALAAGAHFLDVKEPSRGPLGAADAETWSRVREVVSGRRPLSAALGELHELATAHVAFLGGFQFAKIGLAGCAARAGWWRDWSAALRRIPRGIGRVAVAYADHRLAGAPPPEDVLWIGGELGCTALLVDTFEKCARSLFAYCPPESLERLRERAQAAGMLVVIGGSLDAACGETAARLGADYLAVRGAVCALGRQGRLEGHRVRWWVEQLALWPAAAPPIRTEEPRA